MLIKAKSIDHVNMTVKNLDETVKFYSKLFGFRILKEQPEEQSKIIGNNYIKMCLYEDKNFDSKAGINHFGFYVENFDQVEKICEEMNIEIQYDGALDWEKSRSFYIVDPSGYSLELSENEGGGL